MVNLPQSATPSSPRPRACVRGADAMSDIGGAEEIFEQTSARVNKRTKHGKLNWDFPPNLEHTHVQREKKKKPKPIAAKKQAVESVANPPTVTCIARPVVCYKGLIEVCRHRANELALSRLEIDRLSGLPIGYSAKLLGKADGVPRKKRMWPASLEAILGTLGLQIIIIEDHAATARTLSRRVPVDHSNQRFDNKCNSKQVPQLAAPVNESAPVSRAHLRVIQGKRRGSKYG
jgi:hypothetical protein